MGKYTLLILSILLSASCATKQISEQSQSQSTSLPLQPSWKEFEKEIELDFDVPAKPKPSKAFIPEIKKIKIPSAKRFVSLEDQENIDTAVNDTPLIFDVPIAYNDKVQYWIHFFQTSGKGWFTKWLERSSRYLPVLKRTLKNEGVPQDLAYLAMIESGFSAHANSTAKAVGPWQFIRETGNRYGLKTVWWLDERKDFQKSTIAAAKYLKMMYGMFNNWYLVAAGYNTGENRIKRAVQRHNTKNFWKIAEKDLMEETKDYVPKFIAALLIAKAPEMYGFRDVHYSEPLTFEHFRVPGGTKLKDLADAIGVTKQYLEELNPELVKSYIPEGVEGHLIRIPKGSLVLVSQYVRKNFVVSR